MSDYINHDISFQILKWMPVKPLLQWRCVCKSWKQLIDSPNFILEHLATQRSRLIIQNKSVGLLNPNTLPLYDILTGPDGVTTNDFSHFAVICSVHGVICLSDVEEFLLWNPSIRQFIRIPIPKNQDFLDTGFIYSGFWIDLSTNAFKIVSLNLQKDSISLFSSVNDAWKEISVAEEMGRYSGDWLLIGGLNSVMIDGVTHWIASDISYEDYVIIFFDFGQEKIGTIELPELPIKSSSSSDSELVSDKNVCKWNGLLSFVQWHDETHKCDFWVMMQSGSWSKMSSFSLASEINEVVYVLEDWGRGVLAATRDDLVLYDPKDGCIIPLGFDRTKYSCCCCFVVDFVESFVFPYRK